MTKERLACLLELYNLSAATPSEENELMAWLHEAEEDSLLKQITREEWQREFSGDSIKDIDWDKMYNSIIQKQSATSAVSLRAARFNLWRAGIAATLFLPLVGISYFLFFKAPSSTPQTQQAYTKKDIAAPAITKASIRLSDGRVIALNTLHDGATVNDHNAEVVKTADGGIVYNGVANANVYNTLINPKGSQVANITLSDGSRVWLNAGSSLYYPVVFDSRERPVTIDGEGYFEVAKKPGIPFKVSIAGKGSIEVTGTQFSVSAYNDDPLITATLIEGSINLTSVASKTVLKMQPNDQAILNTEGKLSVEKNPDVEQAIAWRNNKFNFNGAEITAVMRQLSRWYDVDVEYKKGPMHEEFVGVISRSVNISQLLSMLEKTGAVTFEVRGNKVIVN